MDYKYYVWDHEICIFNSVKFKKYEFETILKEIYDKDKNHNRPIWTRSIESMKYEWALHNFLYNIGFLKIKTVDVNFEYPYKIPRFLYSFFGRLSWYLIK